MGGEEVDFNELVKLMPKGWEEKARELGAFARARNIKSVEDLLLVNFLYLTSAPSFGSTSAILKATEKIMLNKNAVYERIGKSEKWLGWLVANIYRENKVLVDKPAWLLKKEVCLIDGSDEPVYGSEESNFRLHYCVNLFSLSMKEMHLTQIETGEKLSNFESLGIDDVVVADRAYGTISGLEYMREKGCGFVIRLRSKCFSFYNKKHRKVELANYFTGLREHESKSVVLYYKINDTYEPIRVCATRKDRDSERKGLISLQKTKARKQRGDVSKAQSLYNKYIIVATSFEDDVSAHQVTELYRMRWQIELVFKRLKSLFHYNEIPSKLDATARAWFYGKLLLAAVCEALVNKGRFSPSKQENL
jgi:hypothetical protein